MNPRVTIPGLPLAKSTWGDEEVEAACAVIRSGRTTMGALTRKYEQQFAEYIGTKYAVACNSGSSANLLMVAAWTLRYGPGTVIVPALGWSTSYSPFQQYGWRLRFVDIDRETLNYDLDGLHQAIREKAHLILAINILGNPNDFDAFLNIDVLEDNCESLGAEYRGKRTGSFGVMASHSTFFAHHICTMEGGVVTTDDPVFYDMLQSLRSHGWTRHRPGATPGAWEFILPGYNVRPMEVQSAIGIEQLKRLDVIVAQRRANADAFPLPKQREPDGGRSSWYGFTLFVDDVAALKAQFDERGIEHRSVISGNFRRHKTIAYYNQVSGPLLNADYVHDHGLMIGNSAEPIDWSILDGVVL